MATITSNAVAPRAASGGLMGRVPDKKDIIAPLWALYCLGERLVLESGKVIRGTLAFCHSITNLDGLTAEDGLSSGGFTARLFRESLLFFFFFLLLI